MLKKELLGKVKSTKMSYYGHVVRKHNSLENEVIQGCTSGSIEVLVDSEDDEQMT